MHQEDKMTICKSEGKITMVDIARAANVSQPVVSAVLNNNFKHIKVSRDNREKILRIARENNYYFNAAARALSSKRTGNIGFILSDNISDGWANATFARCLNGAESACRKMGYNINICRYNLSNLDSFVFPEKIGQRSVDGLLFTGYVNADVLRKFSEFDIPGVCIGDNLGVRDIMPTVACDFVDGLYQAVKTLGELGHRHIIICAQQTERENDIIAQLIFLLRYRNCPVDIDYYQPETYQGNYNDATALFEYWKSFRIDKRPSAIISTDQVLISLLSILQKENYCVPEDLSLISTCESALCHYGLLPLSSIGYDLEKHGNIAASMLIEHLSDSTRLTPDDSKVEPCYMNIRESISKHK